MNYSMQGMTKTIPELFVMLKSMKVEIKKEYQVLMIDKITTFNTHRHFPSTSLCLLCNSYFELLILATEQVSNTQGLL